MSRSMLAEMAEVIGDADISFINVSPSLLTSVEAAVRPSPARIAELLARKPDQGSRGLTLGEVDKFLYDQRRRYPQNYRESGEPAPIATREQVEAAIAAKVGASSPPAAVAQLKENDMSTAVTSMADAYMNSLESRGVALSLDERQAIYGFAATFAASSDLQNSYARIGGFACYAAGERAAFNGLTWRVGEARPRRR